MLNENHNDPSFWRSKLDVLDGLEGEIYNKAGGWDKLHERLKEKRLRTKAIWYWAAAALLVAFLTTWLLGINNKEIHMSKNNTGSKRSGVSATPIPSADSHVISQPIPIAKQPLAKSKVANSKQDAILLSRITTLDSITLAAHAINHPSTQNSTSDQPDTAAIALVVPLKKKLRIVHFNELDNGPEQVQFVRNEATPVFPKQHANSQIFSRITVSSNSSDNILKIKLSPSN
jgi:hypothetical protein